MIEESNKLDEVVVTGRQITRTTDKVLYFPSKEQLRHASDGYKALALMMIPTLDVDPFTKKVSTIQGETGAVIEKLPELSLISPFTNTESCMKQRTVAEETAFLCSSTRRPFKQIF